MLSSLSSPCTTHSYGYKSTPIFRGVIWPHDGYGDGSQYDFFGSAIVATANTCIVGAWGESAQWYVKQKYAGYVYVYSPPTGVTSGLTAATAGSRTAALSNPWATTGTSSSDQRATNTNFAYQIEHHPKNPNGYVLIDGSGYRTSTVQPGRLYYMLSTSPTTTTYKDSPYTTSYTGYAYSFGIAKDGATIVGAQEYGSPSSTGRFLVYSSPTNTAYKQIYLSTSPVGHRLGASVAIDYNGTEYWYAAMTQAVSSNTTIYLANSSGTWTTSISTTETVNLAGAGPAANTYIIAQPNASKLKLRGNTLITVTATDVHVRNVLTHSQSISSNGYYKITGFTQARQIELIDNLLYVSDVKANTYGGIYLYDINKFAANATSNVVNKNSCQNQILNTGYKDGYNITRSANGTSTGSPFVGATSDSFGITFSVVNRRIYIGGSTTYGANTSNVGSGIIYVYDNFGV